MFVRGNKLKPDNFRIEGDATLTSNDYTVAQIFVERLRNFGIYDNAELKQLALCMTYVRKFPGIQYSKDIMDKLRKYSVNTPYI